MAPSARTRPASLHLSQSSDPKRPGPPLYSHIGSSDSHANMQTQNCIDNGLLFSDLLPPFTKTKQHSDANAAPQPAKFVPATSTPTLSAKPKRMTSRGSSTCQEYRSPKTIQLIGTATRGLDARIVCARDTGMKRSPQTKQRQPIKWSMPNSNHFGSLLTGGRSGKPWCRRMAKPKLTVTESSRKVTSWLSTMFTRSGVRKLNKMDVINHTGKIAISDGGGANGGILYDISSDTLLDWCAGLDWLGPT
mmetsp:Transcript_50982/g.144418  ORF Transcript_50982/g.144418 Transcript_50982/m.144418 type:complete len:248 (+) Transcript_50982:681-1424(+)